MVRLKVKLKGFIIRQSLKHLNNNNSIHDNKTIKVLFRASKAPVIFLKQVTKLLNASCSLSCSNQRIMQSLNSIRLIGQIQLYLYNTTATVITGQQLKQV